MKHAIPLQKTGRGRERKLQGYMARAHTYSALRRHLWPPALAGETAPRSAHAPSAALQETLVAQRQLPEVWGSGLAGVAQLGVVSCTQRWPAGHVPGLQA